MVFVHSGTFRLDARLHFLLSFTPLPYHHALSLSPSVWSHTLPCNLSLTGGEAAQARHPGQEGEEEAAGGGMEGEGEE